MMREKYEVFSVQELDFSTEHVTNENFRWEQENKIWKFYQVRVVLNS